MKGRHKAIVADARGGARAWMPAKARTRGATSGRTARPCTAMDLRQGVTSISASSRITFRRTRVHHQRVDLVGPPVAFDIAVAKNLAVIASRSGWSRVRTRRIVTP